MWNLDEALELIRELQPKVRELGYHVLLGGGVLNEGKSDKDLDLFFIPLNNYQGNDDELVKYLFDRFSWLDPIRDSPDYMSGDMWHYKHMLKNKSEQRIDFFIQ
jgi:hypothetical protein